MAANLSAIRCGSSTCTSANLCWCRSNSGFVYAAESIFGQLDRHAVHGLSACLIYGAGTEIGRFTQLNCGSYWLRWATWIINPGRIFDWSVHRPAGRRERLIAVQQGTTEWPLEKLQQFLYQLGRDMFDLMRRTVSPSSGWPVLRINDVKVGKFLNSAR